MGESQCSNFACAGFSKCAGFFLDFTEMEVLFIMYMEYFGNRNDVNLAKKKKIYSAFSSQSLRCNTCGVCYNN